MKNSTKFILILLAAISILIAVLTVITRNIVNDHLVFTEDEGTFRVNITEDAGDRVEREYNFTDFDEIYISGGWDVLVIKDDEFRITVDLYESSESQYRVSESNGKLKLAMKDVVVSGRIHGASATIYMPELEAVDVEGVVNMNIEGFTEDKLRLKLDGAGSITGEDCDIENFSISSNGAINIDFDQSDIENAEVYIDGAGNIELNMTGGSLEGNLEGFANLEYSGDVSRLAVEKDGFGSISHRD